MSIQEAMQRSPTRKGSRFSRDWRKVFNEYESLVESRGDEILDNALVPSLINELRDIIVIDYPDVNFFAGGPMSFSHDERGFRLEWNFRTPAEPTDPSVTEYSTITIAARPSNNQIAIFQGDGIEILAEYQWRKREVVEDAIVRAYQNPGVGTNRRISA